MKALRADTATELFTLAMGYLRDEGVRAERDRGSMLEAPGPVTLTLDYPEQNLVLTPARRLNPWVTLAEFPWMIVGRSDIGWLLPYLPRAGDFSDDGIRWRAAYGPRLREWRDHIGYKADQLAYAINELRRPGGSRRAVMSMWNPGTDYVGNSKDYPCTNWLSFQFRPGAMAVDLTVGMRSNDAWWGWSAVNMVNFTLLLQAMCEWSGGLAAGSYHHVADNFHVYVDRHGEVATNIEPFEPDVVTDVNTFRGDLRMFSVAATHALNSVEVARARTEPGKRLFERPGDFKGGGPDWLEDWRYFMGLHPLRNDAEALARALEEFHGRRCDWQRAAMQWALKGEWK